MIVNFSTALLNELRKTFTKDTTKCMTLDIWSDRSKSTFLGANLHVVDKSFVMLELPQTDANATLMRNF